MIKIEMLRYIFMIMTFEHDARAYFDRKRLGVGKHTDAN